MKTPKILEFRFYKNYLTHLYFVFVLQNKSLLVDCTPETEYSTKKLFVIRRLPNDSNGCDSSSSCDTLDGSYADIIDDLDDNCNLFVKECLRTYSTPYLEIANPLDEDEDEADLRLIKEKLEARGSFGFGRNRFHENGIIHSTSALDVPSKTELAGIVGKSSHLSTCSSTSILNKECTGVDNPDSSSTKNRDCNGGSTSGRESPQSPARAPAWFWDVSCQSRGIELDEAGIALEGRLSVNYKEDPYGERFVQVKWDDQDERFYFIAWTHDAGREYVCKVDLGEADPVWIADGCKLAINDDLYVHSEQRRGLLRDLYTVCVELGCYDKSACLASADNVVRARNLVHLFQRVDVSHLFFQTNKFPYMFIKHNNYVG